MDMSGSQLKLAVDSEMSFDANELIFDSLKGSVSAPPLFYSGDNPTSPVKNQLEDKHAAPISLIGKQQRCQVSEINRAGN